MRAGGLLKDRLAFARRECARTWPYLTLLVAFAVSRLVYRFAFGVRFDHTPTEYFIQYLPNWFVEHDFWRSLLYLHQQAPLQNLLTGGCIRLFGNAAFDLLRWLYVGCGLTTAIVMLHVMLRLGASRALAVLAASLYTAFPVTVLYENWLIYHTPVATLHLLSLAALLRYYRTGSFAAGLCFFGLFAGASLFYALFGPMLLIAATALFLIRPPRSPAGLRAARRRMLAALSLPLAVLVLNLKKTELLLGYRHGEAFLWENLAVKTANELEPAQRQFLVKRGRLSPAIDIQLFSRRLSSYDDLDFAHQPTGIPLLDLDEAPDGQPNPHALGHVLIADRYFKKDALYLFRHRPAAFWIGFSKALTEGYFLSALDYDDTLFSQNRESLRPLVDKLDALLLPNEHRVLRALVFIMPLTVLYGIYRTLAARALLESERAAVATISYMVLMICYVTLAVTVIAVGDFSRYRFNVDPFYLILFVLLSSEISARAERLWRSRRQGSAAKFSAAVASALRQ